MDANRKTAYNTLMDVEGKKAYSNLALNHNIILRKPKSKGFVRELVYGVLENKMLLDYIIDALIESDVKKLRLSDLIILRMGLYQLIYMDSVPEYAAVNESVILAKAYARGRQGFINGVLRGYIHKRYDIKLPDRTQDELRYLSIKYSYEPWIISLWMEAYDVDFVEKLLEAGNQTPDLTIRLNWLKVMKEDLIQSLKDKGYKVEEGHYSQNALHVSGDDLLGTKLYKNGMFSIQDEASQMVAQLLEPAHGDLVMDVCAAPGGKTLAIAERMNNTGTVIASDIYKRKMEMVAKEAERLGITNVKTRTWDGTKVDSTMVGKADKVLVDAPCSGLGVVRRKPEIKYKQNNQEMSELPVKQLGLLTASSKYVKPGGVLMYSTCTINPYENERVVSDFLRKNPAFRVDQTKQMLPHVHKTDGFFICKMIKKDSLIEA